MAERVSKLYRPAEMRAAIVALQKNAYPVIDDNAARAIVLTLHKLGFRIAYVGTGKENT